VRVPQGKREAMYNTRTKAMRSAADSGLTEGTCGESMGDTSLHRGCPHVLFIVPSLRRSGAETQVVELVNGLSAAGVERHLLVFENNVEQVARLCRDVHLVRVERRRKFDMGLVRQIATEIDQRRIDVVHCSLQIALFFGWLGARLSKRKPPVVVAVHTTKNRGRKEEFFDRVIFRWMMKGCERVIFVCRAQAGHWCEKFPFLRQNSGVVHNGIDTAYFDRQALADQEGQLREALGIARRGILIGNVAAFRPEKGHAVLIEAFRKVMLARSDVTLLCVGEGSTRASVEELARRKGVSKNVTFLGARDDVRSVLAAVDMVVLPSTAVETFSMAALEALAMGVPVIGSDIGGMREAVIDGETGRIVRPGDSDALAEAILELADNPEYRKRLGESGQKIVRERFTKQLMVRETAAVLRDVVARANQGSRGVI
jgi:glycosyltransferase involved in cell wall biosynthesis